MGDDIACAGAIIADNRCAGGEGLNAYNAEIFVAWENKTFCVIERTFNGFVGGVAEAVGVKLNRWTSDFAQFVVHFSLTEHFERYA